MGKQVGQRHRVVDVGLAPEHVFDACGVGQHQLELPLENVPHRLPVHARGLHGDLLDTERLQPIGQFEQARWGGAKGANLLPQGAFTRNARASHHSLLVHVQLRAARTMTSMMSSISRRHRRVAHVIEV